MNKNSKILLIVGGMVILGAIGFFVWPFGDQAGANVPGPVVTSDSDPDLSDSDDSTPVRGQPNAGSGRSSARLSADPDQGNDAAASEDTLAASKKKGDRKRVKRKNRNKDTDSDAEDADAGNKNKLPPTGNFEDDL